MKQYLYGAWLVFKHQKPLWRDTFYKFVFKSCAQESILRMLLGILVQVPWQRMPFCRRILGCTERLQEDTHHQNAVNELEHGVSVDLVCIYVYRSDSMKYLPHQHNNLIMYSFPQWQSVKLLEQWGQISQYDHPRPHLRRGRHSV